MRVRDAAGLLPVMMLAAACADAPPDRVEGGAPGAAAGDAPSADVTPGSDATAAGATDRTAAFVPAPAFDCDAAGLGEVEMRICADSALATLDVRLDSVWTVALARARGTAMPAAWVDEMRAYQRGWVEGRNECWKAPEQAAYANVDGAEAIRRCTETAYRERIARLQAEWGIAERTAGPVFWACRNDPADEFVTTYYATEPEAARVERGDQSEIFLRTRTASGARYEGLFGKWFWNRGDSATFVWPQTDTLPCVVRDPNAPEARADTAGRGAGAAGTPR